MAVVRISGEDRDLDGPDDMTLLWALRDLAGLTGTKYGCGVGLCGACTVHVDGVAARSCMLTVAEVAGKEITTIEGLSPTGDHPVQAAWRELNVPQCGFCQAGQIMQAASLLAANPSPTDQEILTEMEGNVCRCGCYERIVAAVRLAATGS
ncbi:(2Fe-2S)-binding protein [Algihabitans albus]|uniref:(2Fe-2S)-binding protein n=1 Tax=Algihabitans albus TaxID=2164067 RepID=UPI000E5CEE98|nr:(2Fe-2S)-binding protein [Algihabitans albus]